MKNKIFMDTGFVMAVVNDKDQHHPDAVKLANRFRNYPTIITDAVLLEIGNSLARNFKEQAIDLINHFYSSKETTLIHVHPLYLGEVLTYIGPIMIKLGSPYKLMEALKSGKVS